MYSLRAYYASKMILDVPLQTVYPFVYSFITFWLAGFDIGLAAGEVWPSFCKYMVTIMLLGQVGASLGYVISAAAKNVHVAATAGPLIVLPLFIFGGLFVHNDDCPPYFLWVRFLSFINYGFEANLVAVVGEIDAIACENTLSNRLLEMGHFSAESYAEVASLPPELRDKPMCRYYDGKQVVKSYGFDENASTYGYNCAFLALEGLVLRIIAFLLLLRNTRLGARAGGAAMVAVAK
eukprot:g12179.t1